MKLHTDALGDLLFQGSTCAVCAKLKNIFEKVLHKLKCVNSYFDLKLPRDVSKHVVTDDQCKSTSSD